MIDKWNGVLYSLCGFENNIENGGGWHLNFILSNGDRSTQRDEYYKTRYTHMIPKDAQNKIKRVTIYYDNYCICSFLFFDKDGALLFKIGWTNGSLFK